MDLEDDCRTLQQFTLIHNAGKKLSDDYEAAKHTFLVAKREWEAKKQQAQSVPTTSDYEKAESSGTEDANAEILEISTPEPVLFTEPSPPSPPLPTYPTSYWDQITKDVDRSLWKQVPVDADRAEKRDQLHRIICAVICTTTDDEKKPLHYFQGYHDIAAVCLLTCGEVLGYSLLKRLSKTYLRYVSSLFPV
jgi:hypothetical protein